MDVRTFVSFVIPAWVAIGLITGLVMGRRGHELVPWTVLGVVFGPFAVLLAIDAHRRRGPERLVHAGRPGGGTIDVLAGIDGSAASLAALEAATRLLGPRIGRLTLAYVLDRDQASSPERATDEAAAERLLDEAAAGLTRRDADRVLLVGRPEVALTTYAAEHGFELIAIGPRGRGLSKALIGSVATRLAAHPGAPVLIAGGRPVRIDLTEPERRAAR